jgi:hypothetical protein
VSSSKTGGPRLKQLVKLSERKEALMAEIQNIDRDMLRLEQEFQQSSEQKRDKGKVTFSREAKKRRNVQPASSQVRRKVAR